MFEMESIVCWLLGNPHAWLSLIIMLSIVFSPISIAIEYGFGRMAKGWQK
jgi:hypothetical protein